MIFLTVGTQFPFDRLVKSFDELITKNGFDEEIFAQIGNSQYEPKGFKAVVSIEKHLFDKYMLDASYIISHAGMGTITMALENHKSLLVMPRKKKYGEVVNDHQVAIAKKFEELGHILVANDTTELPGKIEQLKTFVSNKRRAQPDAVARRISLFLNDLSVQRKL
jgi:beta-1,4-N-acetylglucosaminyltransferase